MRLSLTKVIINCQKDLYTVLWILTTKDKKMKIALMLLALVFLLIGCYQTNDEDGLRAMPVTNNPSITPQRDLGPMQGMPY